MISFSKIVREILSERMSFKDLLRNSDPKRIDRSKSVSPRSIRVAMMDNNEAWLFNYKSNPSTTGKRHHGYIKFFKKDVSSKDRADELDCKVDCDCEDYKYRFAYNNAKADAGEIGSNAWNDNNGRPPQPYNNNKPSLCKHLISLGKFLKTYIDSDAPSPDDIPDTTVKSKVSPSIGSSPSSDAPSPDDSYTDSKEESGYSDTRNENLQEVNNNLSSKFEKMFNNKREFNVPYE